MFRFVVLTFVVLGLTTNAVTAGQVVYVDDIATGANNGSSWCDAYRYLQDALAAAQASSGAVTEIRVAQGTYKPDQGVNQTHGDRAASFELVNGVALRGGYAGCGAADPNARDIPAYESILSGDLSDNDAPNESNCCLAHRQAGCDDQACSLQVCAISSSCCSSWSPTCAFYARNLCGSICSALTENSYHVVTADDLSTESQLDGLTLTLGNANGPQLSGDDIGGGFRCRYSRVSLTNCSVVSNLSENLGGGLSVSGGIVTITNSFFTRNLSTSGGGLYVGPGSTVLLSSSLFLANATSLTGGAMHAHAASLSVRDCVFQGGYCESFGGAVFYNGGSESATVIDSVFVSNHGRTGGAVCHPSGNLYLATSKFAGNTAIEGGGAIQFGGELEVVDSLLVANAAGDGGGISNNGGSIQLSNCALVYNLANGSGGGLKWYVGVPRIRNTILYSNFGSGGTATGEMAQLDGSVVNITYSCVSGWTGALGGVGNHGNDPLLIGGPFGAWTVYATYDRSNGKATFVDDTASWQPNEWVGKFLNPNTSQYLQSLIVSNTGTAITVLGDFASLGVAGATYKINDYHLSAGSPCIDSGDNSSVPADTFDLDDDGNTTEPLPFDLDGKKRFRDDPLTVDTGFGAAPLVDMGAYEYQPPCESDTDCDNGRFCDGTEVCTAGVCGPGFNPCVGRMCDEVMNACVDCLDDADCDDGDPCNGTESCDATGSCLRTLSPDCNGNAVADACDILTGTSRDTNSNGVPDECDPGACCEADGFCSTTLLAGCGSPLWVEGIACTPNRCPIPPIVAALGSRYLSVTPQSWQPDELVAIRISSPRFPCLSKYVALDSGIGRVIDNPVFLPASQWGTVNVADTEIVPGTTYEVQTENAIGLSYPASATTWGWGDVVPPFNPPSTTTQPDGSDIVGVVDKFKHWPGAPPIEACDLHPAVPNQDVDGSDITMVVDAFKRIPYPFPLPCP